MQIPYWRGVNSKKDGWPCSRTDSPARVWSSLTGGVPELSGLHPVLCMELGPEPPVWLPPIFPICDSLTLRERQKIKTLSTLHLFSQAVLESAGLPRVNTHQTGESWERSCAVCPCWNSQPQQPPQPCQCSALGLSCRVSPHLPRAQTHTKLWFPCTNSSAIPSAVTEVLPPWHKIQKWWAGPERHSVNSVLPLLPGCVLHSTVNCTTSSDGVASQAL